MVAPGVSLGKAAQTPDPPGSQTTTHPASQSPDPLFSVPIYLRIAYCAGAKQLRGRPHRRKKRAQRAPKRTVQNLTGRLVCPIICATLSLASIGAVGARIFALGGKVKPQAVPAEHKILHDNFAITQKEAVAGAAAGEVNQPGALHPTLTQGGGL